jgi:uncharacterized SAM-binding protein YcdF (DUF218 family)
VLACHAGGREFESRHPRHFNARMPSIIKLAKLFKKITMGLSLLWILGMALFIALIPKPATDAVEHTDAIVVLTGGTQRLETGLQIFSETDAKKILISGVGYKVTKKDILKNFSKQETRLKINPNDIILGSIADSTISNATEAKMFMDLHKFTTLRLITSNYHMPRSILTFKRYMPDYVIIQHPVGQENISLFNGKFKLIFNEYNKLLGFIFLTIWEWYGYYFDTTANFILLKISDFSNN